MCSVVVLGLAATLKKAQEAQEAWDTQGALLRWRWQDGLATKIEKRPGENTVLEFLFSSMSFSHMCLPAAFCVRLPSRVPAHHIVHPPNLSHVRPLSYIFVGVSLSACPLVYPPARPLMCLLAHPRICLPPHVFCRLVSYIQHHGEFGWRLAQLFR